MPITMKAMQESRTVVKGSSNKQAPRKAVPMVPIPVHTAYAVPMGSTFIDIPRKTTLNTILAYTRAGTGVVKPPVDLSPTAQPISNNPARIRISQALVTFSPLPTAFLTVASRKHVARGELADPVVLSHRDVRPMQLLVCPRCQWSIQWH